LHYQFIKTGSLAGAKKGHTALPNKKSDSQLLANQIFILVVLALAMPPYFFMPPSYSHI
jgi:hypothetical protein